MMRPGSFPRRHRPQPLVRPRRGATLVLVAMLVTILVGLTGVAVDFSRMYAFRAQLKTLTDASALSAVTDLKRGVIDEEVADTRVLTLIRPNNRVEGSILDDAGLSAADVQPVQWDFTTRRWAASSWGSANGVRVTARYTAAWSVGRIFGQNTRVLTESSVAALGAQRVSGCLKPFAVPYSALLRRVGRSIDDLTHDLTADEIQMLRNNVVPDTFRLDVGNQPGNFGYVEFPPNDETNKNSYLASVITQNCTASPVEVGDTLPGFTGNTNAGEIRTAMRALCPGLSNQLLGSCNPMPSIEVPIYDWAEGTGSTARYRVRYIGAFTLTGADFSASNNVLIARLTALGGSSTGGGYTPFPGPVQIAALVQ